MSVLTHTWLFAGRRLIEVRRQPMWIVIMLVQPVVWLVCFGALFQSATSIPGFAGNDFREFLTPGIVVMTAFYSAGWAGTRVIHELQSGVIDRFLIAPTSRISIALGSMVQPVVTALIQSAILVVLATLMGTRFPGGVIGLLVMALMAALIAVGVGALSWAIALAAKHEETVVGVINFILLPAVFLSTTFQQRQLMPHWVQVLSDLNPYNWAVEGARSAALDTPIDPSQPGGTDWVAVGWRGVALVLFAIAAFAITDRAFARYRRRA